MGGGTGVTRREVTGSGRGISSIRGVGRSSDMNCRIRRGVIQNEEDGLVLKLE